MGGRAGSGDLVIDETNQATGKRVFPRSLGAAATGSQLQRARLRPRLQSNSNFQEPEEHAVKPLHSPGCPE